MIILGVKEVDLLPLIICQGFKTNLLHGHKNYLYWSKNSDLIRLFENYFVQFNKKICVVKDTPACESSFLRDSITP